MIGDSLQGPRTFERSNMRTVERLSWRTMGLRRSEAIVIGGHSLAEADRIIPFYTRDLGMVRAVAQGARRLRSRFGGSLELFTHGQVVYFERPNRTLHSINEFSVLNAFSGLR